MVPARDGAPGGCDVDVLGMHVVDVSVDGQQRLVVTVESAQREGRQRTRSLGQQSNTPLRACAVGSGVSMVFQLVSTRYKRGTMIITGNKSFAKGAASSAESSPPPSSTGWCTTATSSSSTAQLPIQDPSPSSTEVKLCHDHQAATDTVRSYDDKPGMVQFGTAGEG